MKKFSGMALVLFLISPVSHATDVSREQWISVMETALPTAFCNSAQYFRQCFDVTATECEETAASAARVCLEKFSDQIPDILHQPQDGNAWGTRVGQCAGSAYDATLASKKISNAKCNNPANWQ